MCLGGVLLSPPTYPRTLITTALVLMTLMPSAKGGPWTKELGQLYAKLNQGFFVSNSFTNSAGMVVGGTDYLGATTSLYFEAGLYRQLQLQGLIPYTIGINSFAEQGIDTLRAGGGDMLLGLQASPPFWPQLPLAVRLELKIPLYDVGAGSPPSATGAAAQGVDFPALGDGQVDITLWLAAGTSLERLPLYAWAEVGYRFRTELFIGDGPDAPREYLDSFVWLGQIGWKFYRELVLGLNFIGVVALGSDELTKSYVTLGPMVYLPVYRGLAIEAYFDPVVYARNSARGFGTGVGFSYSR